MVTAHASSLPALRVGGGRGGERGGCGQRRRPRAAEHVPFPARPQRGSFYSNGSSSETSPHSRYSGSAALAAYGGEGEENLART